MEISQQIAQARKKNGLTQEQLAELTKVTVRTIQRIENGQSIPRAFTLKAIASALGTTIEELAGAGEAGISNFDTASDKHFLQVLCLSCFGYLVIPFVHFLVPMYLLKKSNIQNPQTLAFGRWVVRQQLYWVATLNFAFILALAYNFIAVRYLGGDYFLHYLWIFFVMYFLKACLIVANLIRVKNMDLDNFQLQKA